MYLLIKIGRRKNNNDQNEGVRTAYDISQGIMAFIFIPPDQWAQMFVLAKTARHDFLLQ